MRPSSWPHGHRGGKNRAAPSSGARAHRPRCPLSCRRDACARRRPCVRPAAAAASEQLLRPRRRLRRHRGRPSTSRSSAGTSCRGSFTAARTASRISPGSRRGSAWTRFTRRCPSTPWPRKRSYRCLPLCMLLPSLPPLRIYVNILLASPCCLAFPLLSQAREVHASDGVPCKH